MAFVDVEKKAYELLARSGAPRLSNGIAIDIERIARATCDYDVAFVPMLSLGGASLSGAIIPQRRVLFVEAHESKKRQRFTIAHELGHFEIDYGARTGPQLFPGPVNNEGMYRCTVSDISEVLKSRRAEMLANKFAAEMLMPRGLVAEVWARFRDPKACARALGVSQQALEIRLTELKLG